MTDSDTEYRGRGVVKMNPNGPTFYVNVIEGQKPTGMSDLITDRMNIWLTEFDDEHSWPITHEHIRPHTAICGVEWVPADDNSGYGVELDLDLPDTAEEDWYTHEEQSVGPS